MDDVRIQWMNEKIMDALKWPETSGRLRQKGPTAGMHKCRGKHEHVVEHARDRHMQLIRPLHISHPNPEPFQITLQYNQTEHLRVPHDDCVI